LLDRGSGAIKLTVGQRGRGGKRQDVSFVRLKLGHRCHTITLAFFGACTFYVLNNTQALSTRQAFWRMVPFHFIGIHISYGIDVQG
jgi:hypothetical protein